MTLFLSLARVLGTCQWVHVKQNVIIIGMTGTGKSYVAVAINIRSRQSGSMIINGCLHVS